MFIVCFFLVFLEVIGFGKFFNYICYRRIFIIFVILGYIYGKGSGLRKNMGENSVYNSVYIGKVYIDCIDLMLSIVWYLG